jgi:hypothetical protein
MLPVPAVGYPSLLERRLFLVAENAGSCPCHHGWASRCQQTPPFQSRIPAFFRGRFDLGQHPASVGAEEGAKRAYHLHPESLSRAFSRACDRLRIADATALIESSRLLLS